MKIDFENLLPINHKFRVVEFYYFKDNSSSRIENYKHVWYIAFTIIHAYKYHDSVFENFKQFLFDEYICIKQYIFFIYEIILL